MPYADVEEIAAPPPAPKGARINVDIEEPLTGFTLAPMGGLPSGEDPSLSRPLDVPPDWHIDRPSIEEAPAEPSLIERTRRGMSKILGPTEAQKIEEAVPITKPNGEVTYEYKPAANEIEKRGLIPALIEAGSAVVDLPTAVNLRMNGKGSTLSDIDEERQAQMFQPDANDSAPVAIGKAAHNAVLNFSHTIANPALLAVPGSRILSTGFAVDMAHGAIEQAKQAKEAPTIQGKIEGALGALLSAAFAYQSGSHAAKGHPAQTLSKEASTKIIADSPTEALRVALTTPKIVAHLHPDIRNGIEAEIAAREGAPIAPNGEISATGMLYRARKHRDWLDKEIARESDDGTQYAPDANGIPQPIPQTADRVIDKRRVKELQDERDALDYHLTSEDAPELGKIYGFDIKATTTAADALHQAANEAEAVGATATAEAGHAAAEALEQAEREAKAKLRAAPPVDEGPQTEVQYGRSLDAYDAFGNLKPTKPHAQQIQKPSAPDGGVRAPEVTPENAALPAAESRQGIQPSGQEKPQAIAPEISDLEQRIAELEAKLKGATETPKATPNAAEAKPSVPAAQGGIEAKSALPVGARVRSKTYQSEGEIQILGEPTTINGRLGYDAYFSGTKRAGRIQAAHIDEIIARPETSSAEAVQKAAPTEATAEAPAVSAESVRGAAEPSGGRAPGADAEKQRSFKAKPRKPFPQSSSGHDAIDILLNIGKLKHPETARWEALHRAGKGIGKTTERGGEYDELSKLPPELLRHITEGVYRRKGEGKDVSPDSAAMEVYPNEEGVTAEKLIPELLDAYNSRLRHAENLKKQEAEGKAAETKAEAQTAAFETESKQPESGGEKLPASDLNVGDKVEVNGETMEVIDVDPDTGNVTLEDGSRYGVQELKDDGFVYGEIIEKAQKSAATDSPYGKLDANGDPDWFAVDETVDTPAKAAEVLVSENLVTSEVASSDRSPADESAQPADAAGQAGASSVAAGGEVAPLPKLRRGENQGDLLSTQTEDLTLVGETGVATVRRAEEAALKAKDAAEAKTLQDKQQLDIFAEKPESEPAITPEERQSRIDRIKEIKPRILKLGEKGGLTNEKATEYKGLMREMEDLRYEIRRPLALEKIPSPEDRKSTIPSEVVLTARNELTQNKDIYSAISEAAAGVHFNAETAVDSIVAGRNQSVSHEQLYDAFSGTRDALRKHYGDWITLYRSVGKQKSKPTTNWATTKENAEQFGGNVIKKDVPVDDVIAVNVGLGGKYEELIVGERPAPSKEATTPIQEPTSPIKGTLTKAALEKLHTDAYSIADTIANSVAKGQPDSVREAAFDAAYRNAAASIESGGQFNPDFMRKSAMTAAGKEAAKLGTSLDAPIGEGETTGQDLLPSKEAGPVEHAQAGDMQAMIEAAMAKLPETERRIMEEVAAGTPVDVIAENLGMTEGSVRTLVSKARNTLKEKLKGKLAPESISDSIPKEPISREELKSVVKDLKAKFKGAAETAVVSDGSLLPQAALDAAKALGIDPNRIGGIYHDGTVWLNAAALESPHQAQQVWFHEQAGHHGVSKILDGIKPGSAATLGKVLKREFKDEWEYVSGDQKTGKPPRYAQHQWVDETLARIMEKFGPENADRPGAWRRVLDYIRTVLARAGFTEWDRKSVDALLRRGIERIRSRGDVEGGETKLSIKGETPRTTGVAQRVHEARAERGEINQIEPGVGVNTEDLIQAARTRRAAGLNPEVVMDAAEARGFASSSEFADMRVHGEALARQAGMVGERFGYDSPAYQDSLAAEQSWLERIKPFSTEAHKVFMAHQGETEIDTGTFHGMEKAFRERNGRGMTADEKEKAKQQVETIRKLDEKITELQTKVDEFISGPPAPTTTEILGRVLEDIKKTRTAKASGKSLINHLKDRGIEALQKLTQLRDKTVKFSIEGEASRVPALGGEELALHAQYGSSLIASGAKSKAEFTKRLVEVFGEPVRAHADEIFDASKKQNEIDRTAYNAGKTPKKERTPEEVKAAAVDHAKETPEGTAPTADSSTIYDLVRARVAEEPEMELSKPKIAEVMDSVAADLQEIEPGITGDKVRDIFTNYGQQKHPSGEEVATKMRELHATSLLVSKLQHQVSEGFVRPTGMKRGKPTALDRELMKELSRKMREMGLPPERVEGMLKSAHDARVTRLKNAIEDTERQMQTRQRTPKTKPIDWTPEELALKDQLGEMKTRLDEMLNEPDSDELSSVMDRIEAVTDRLATGNIKPKAKSQNVPTKELSEARDRLSELNRELAERRKTQRDIENPPKTEEEKTLESLLKRNAKAREILASGNLSTRTGKPTAATKEISDAQAELYETNRLIAEARKNSAEAQQRALDSIRKRIQDTRDRLAAGSFTAIPKPTGIPKSAEMLAAESELKSEREKFGRARDAAAGKVPRDAAGLREYFEKQRIAGTLTGKFTPSEVRAIWEHVKTRVDAGNRNFADIANLVGADLGLSPEMVKGAITQNKATRTITNDMYRKMYDRRQAINTAKQWVETANKPRYQKAIRAITNYPRAIAVLGHANAMVTHAGQNAFRPSAWIAWGRGLISNYKFLGSRAAHEAAMQQLVSDPNYNLALRSGLRVAPGMIEDYAAYGKFLGKIGEAGNRAMDSLKTFRMDYFNRELSRFDPAIRQDVAPLLAQWINHISGYGDIGHGTHADIMRETMFAPALEASRWANVVGDPIKYAKIFANWKRATPAERAMARFYVNRMAQLAAVYIGTLMANYGLQRTTGQDDTVNFTDPRKSDWLKFKWDGRTYDPTGGLVGPIRYLADLLQLLNPFKEPFRGQGRLESIAKGTVNFARGKLDPKYGILADILDQKNMIGRPMPFSEKEGTEKKPQFTWGEYALEHSPIPMAEAAREIYKTLGENDVDATTANAITNGLVSFAIGAFGVKEGYTPADIPDEQESHSSTRIHHRR